MTNKETDQAAALLFTYGINGFLMALLKCIYDKVCMKFTRTWNNNYTLNDLKFRTIVASPNSADPDQTASSEAV